MRKDAYPFHAVSGRNLPKHRSVVQDCRVRRIRELRVVRRGAEVEFADGLGEGVQLSGSGGGGSTRGRAW